MPSYPKSVADSVADTVFTEATAPSTATRLSSTVDIDEKLNDLTLKDASSTVTPEAAASLPASKARDGLYRAGELMREIWYFYREESFDKNFTKFTKKAGGAKIYLFKGVDEEPVKIFHNLPKGIETEEDKHAMLSFLGSMEAVAIMQQFVVRLLEDVTTHIEEVSVEIKNPEMQFFTIDPSGNEARGVSPGLHEVWKVTTVDNEKYYIDLTGAQFGFRKTIIPEKEFEEQYAAKVHYYDDKSLGRCARTMDDLDKAVPNDMRFNVGRPLMRGLEGIEMYIKSWKELSKGVLPNELVFLPDKGMETGGYRWNRELFRFWVEEGLQVNVNMLKGNPIGPGATNDFDIVGEGEQARFVRIPKGPFSGVSGEELRAKSTMWPEDKPLPPELVAAMPPFIREMMDAKKTGGK